MSRKKSAPRARKARQVAHVPWNEHHPWLFRIALCLGEAPKTVKVTVVSNGYTFEANFTDEKGNRIVGVARVRRSRDGKLHITEESMRRRFGFRLGSKAEAAA